MAELGLDAADRQHRLPGHVDQVHPHRERDHGIVGQPELAGADEGQPVGEAGLCEAPIDLREADPEREGDVVGEHQRRRPGTALTAVDGDEVDPALSVGHLLDQVIPEHQIADRGFDAHRQPGPVGDPLHHIEHLVDAAERRVPRRALHILPLGYASDARDLGVHLGPGQMPTEPGFRTLAEFELDRAHRRGLHHLAQPVQIETALGVPAAEIAGTDLQHQITALAVMIRQPTLTGVVPATRQLHTAIQRLDRLRAQRTEAHRGDVDHRFGAERMPSAARPAEHLCTRQGRGKVVQVGIRGDLGERALLDHREVQLLHIVVGAEPEVVVLRLRRGVHPAPLVPAERPFLIVGADDVLPQFGTDRLQRVPGPGEQREVVPQCVFALQQILDRQPRQPRQAGHRQRGQPALLLAGLGFRAGPRAHPASLPRMVTRKSESGSKGRRSQLDTPTWTSRPACARSVR